MDLPTISTNQLRQELPEIKQMLLTGQSFYWIDRSKVVATIQSPMVKKTVTMGKKDWVKRVRSLAGRIKIKTSLNPAQLNRRVDQEYEEHLKLV